MTDKQDGMGEQIPITLNFDKSLDRLIGKAEFNSNLLAKSVLRDIDKFVFEVGYIKSENGKVELLEISAVRKPKGGLIMSTSSKGMGAKDLKTEVRKALKEIEYEDWHKGIHQEIMFKAQKQAKPSTKEQSVVVMCGVCNEILDLRIPPTLTDIKKETNDSK